MKPFAIELGKILGPSGLALIEILVLHKPLENGTVMPDLKFIHTFQIVPLFELSGATRHFLLAIG